MRPWLQLELRSASQENAQEAKEIFWLCQHMHLASAIPGKHLEASSRDSKHQKLQMLLLEAYL